LSGRFRKYGDTERCHWWMPGADAGLVVYWSYTRVRGQSQAPPGVPRMSSYLRDRPLSPAHGRRGRGWESVASYEAAPARLAAGDVADRLVGPVHLAHRAPVEDRKSTRL